MKYTHKDIVDSINDRKEGKNKLSWIENFCIYLSKSSCKPREEEKIEKIENVLVLSIENEERLSIYDCFFKIQPNGTRFFVNKAIPNVCFSKLKALLEEVEWNSKATREYWNDVLVKKEETGYNLAKVDESVLQREQTKASCCCPNLSMIDFLSNLGNEIESILQGLEINKSYHKVYIANGANFQSYYPLVAPLQYALYKRFKTDSVEPFVKPELFTKQPLTSFGWKANKARFYTGALSRAIGLNTSVEVSLNDLMNAGSSGVVVTFPLDENNGCYTMPATPVFKECSSDRKKCEDTKTLSLGDVTLTWADLYGQVQWDYKVGELAFKQVKLSIYADGCQRLYLMDGDKVLTVISSNGSTVEVENCLKVSNAEPATVVEIPVDNHANVVEESEEEVAKPTNNKPIKYKGTSPKENRSKGSIFRAKVSAEIQKGLYIVQELLREEVYNFIVKYHPGKTVGMLIEEWINVKKADGKFKYGDKIRRNWDEYKGRNPSWETYNNESEPIKNTEYFDFSNYYIFIEQNATNLEMEWKTDSRELKSHIRNLLKYVRNDSSHQNMYAIKDDDAKCSFTDMIRIVNVFNKEDLAEEIRSCSDTVYELYKNKP